MALTIGTNSWASVAEGDTFLADKIDAEKWFVLSETAAAGARSKESLLVSAFHWLSGSTQLSIPSSCADLNVKNAQIEAAWFLHEYYPELKDRRAAIATGLKSIRMSRRWEGLGTPSVPDYILGLLSDYQTSNTTVLLGGEYDA